MFQRHQRQEDPCISICHPQKYTGTVLGRLGLVLLAELRKLHSFPLHKMDGGVDIQAKLRHLDRELEVMSEYLSWHVFGKRQLTIALLPASRKVISHRKGEQA